MTDVDICNLALAHLGDEATVSSIDPPEGSSQAEHCARYYTVARDTLLQMHTWSFATRRVLLAQVTQPWTMWTYAYALPSDMMTAISVLGPESEGDYTVPLIPQRFIDPVSWTAKATQPYVIETDATGTKVLYTNQESALLRYQARVTQTTLFDPLFAMALTHHLASMLAGPILKGEAGSAESKRQAQMMYAYVQQARASDSSQRSLDVTHTVGWIAGR